MNETLLKRMRRAALAQLAMFALPLGILYFAGYRVLLIDFHAKNFFSSVAVFLGVCLSATVVTAIVYSFFKGKFNRTAMKMAVPAETGFSEIALYRMLCRRYGFRGGFIFLLAYLSGLMVIAVPLYCPQKTLVLELFILIYLAASFLCRRLICRIVAPGEKLRLSRTALVVLVFLLAFPAAGALWLFGEGVREARAAEGFRAQIRKAGGFPALEELNEHFGSRTVTPVLAELIGILETRKETEEIPPRLAELVDQLAATPQVNFSWPETDLYKYDVKEFGTYRKLARLEESRMQLAAGRGDMAETMRIFHDIGALRRQVSSHPMVINILIGLRMENVRLETFLKLLNSGGVFTDVQLCGVIADMDRAEEEIKRTPPVAFSLEAVSQELYRNPALAGVLAGEGSFLAGVLGAADASILLKPMVFWSVRLDGRVTAERIAEYLEISSLDRYRMPDNLWSAPGGAIASALCLPPLELISDRYSEAYANSRAVKIIAALELYRRKHGGYPVSLTALCPEFLQEVPADPFDGKPMRYLGTENDFTVYSVGQNRRDDGGKIIRKQKFSPLEDIGFTRQLP